MLRAQFIKTISGGVMTVGSSGALNIFLDTKEKFDKKMPVLFVGHGSPMNAIETNEFTTFWK